MVERIEQLISQLEAQRDAFKEEYHTSLRDYQKGYLVERAKGYLVGAEKQLKITKDWYRKLKSDGKPKEVNYLAGGKIQYIYSSKMNDL